MKHGLQVLTLAIALSSFNAFAQTESSQPASGQKTEDRGSDKLDLRKLEKKYWSAKDTDFSVVQNRTYSKKQKVFLSLSYGPLVNDAYSYGRMINGAVGYYFSERMGIEVAHEVGNLKNNDSTDAFITRNQFAPDYNTFKKYTSLNYILVPFYAKMSFWDRSIMYFDMQFALGIGQMTYEIQKVNGNLGSFTSANETKTTMGYNFDITQQLFFHENFAIRFDIKNKWSNQTKERYYLNNQQRDLGTSMQQDTSVLLGLTVFF